jgi:8-oxo-dGTP pyrophosphatase MutT (NUDIX family)/nucleoside-triphosphatase THEP1
VLLPKAVGVPLASRIKIMAKMDIADRLRPQGGHASVAIGGIQVDLRVSTLPASHGEKVVIRILDPRSAVRSIDSLGLDSADAMCLTQLLDVREGLLLVTGPTGSGKTTTLYAALKHIQRGGLNIITVEDPVEYRIPGIVQVQINDKARLSFASALRSILRQDPDVVLIGEIRDAETASIAIQASLTGHLVFATLHTNDAASTITRLTDLGVDRARLSAGLRGIVAQRLIRRLCLECRTVANDGPPSRLRDAVADHQMVYTPVGCEACGMTGYHGRVAIMEIATSAHGGNVHSSRSLWESGISHLVAGQTSGDELLRVLDGESLPVRVHSVRETHHYVPARNDMTQVVPGVVDVYVIRPLSEGWQVLVLQRALETRCPGAWEAVHGRIEDGEKPEAAAVREVREETGLSISRLYNVTVQPFYLHTSNTVQIAIVFAAFVDEPAEVKTGAEHQRFEWMSPHDASSRFIWPREREALSHILHLLAGGNAGPVEDVLRVI